MSVGVGFGVSVVGGGVDDVVVAVVVVDVVAPAEKPNG